jgi:hypothetical protein
MMLSASTALVRDAASYRRLRNFTVALNVLITGAMLLLLVPPVFDLIIGRLIGLPPEVAWRTRGAVALLLLWPGAIGFRRFYQGVLIRFDRTRLVAYGTVVRLVSMGTAAGLMAWIGGLEGAMVGGAALSVGTTAEAIASRLMVAPVLRELLGANEESGERLGYLQIASFYYPLVLTALLTMGVHPMVSFFLGRSREAVDSLAVMPVILSLVFIFRSVGLAYQEVGIALIGEHGEGYRPLRRFATLLALGVAATLTLVTWTPLATVWFQIVSGLAPDLAAFAITPARILCLMPGFTVLLSFQRAMLVNDRRTLHVSIATGLEVIGVAAVLTIGIGPLRAIGAIAAASALMIGRLAAVVYLLIPVRAAVRRLTGDRR